MVKIARKKIKAKQKFVWNRSLRHRSIGPQSLVLKLLHNGNGLGNGEVNEKQW